jgi:hypothetical protein
MRYCGKIRQITQYISSAGALHTGNYGYRYIVNMELLLLYHGNSSYANAPHYVYKYTVFPDLN